MEEGPALSVMAGLAIGIFFFLLFAFIFKPIFALPDAQLIAKSKEIRDVQHFLSKYPEAKVNVYRDSQEVTVAYSVSKQLSEATNISSDVIIRTIVLGIIYTNPALDEVELRLYCVGTPEPLATPAFGKEGDMVGRIDNEGCFGTR